MFEQVDAAHMQLSPAMRDPQAIATFSQLSLYYYLSWRFNFCFLHSSTLQREPNYFLAHACCQNTPPEAGLFQANSRSTLCWKGVLQKKARICRGEGNCRDRRHIEDSKKKNRGADDTTSGNPTCIALQGGGGNSSAQILHTDRNLFAMHTRGCGGVQSWHGWKIKCEVRILSSGSGWQKKGGDEKS